MLRTRITLEAIADRGNLLLATWKAAKGKRERPSVARFLDGLDGEIARLASDILEERAPRGRTRTFLIRDPKPRTITAACFADRVLHHAILNLAEPRFERMLVPSTFACRPGRGVHAAVAQVQRHLRSCAAWPWLVQVDVEHYFPSIDHEVLKALLAARFKGAKFLALLGRIIDAGAPGTPGRGLPIGSLTSQHFANAYLDSADRLLLEHPRVRAHVRYMDDIVWWCRSRADAVDTLATLDEHVRTRLALRLKPTAHLGRSVRGLQFCGFRVRPGVVLASSRRLSRYRRAIQRIDAAQEAGTASEQEVQRALDAALATLASCETIGFRRRLHRDGGEAEGVGRTDSGVPTIDSDAGRTHERQAACSAAAPGTTPPGTPALPTATPTTRATPTTTWAFGFA